jgi:hypothetical protein
MEAQMNWGKWIVVSFLLFVGLMATIVTISMKQDVNLVSPQYYQDDLDYQHQLDRKNNAEALVEKPEISIANNQLRVFFGAQAVEGGTVSVFRPSDNRLDQHFRLKSSADPLQVFPMKTLTKGAYRIKMQWLAKGKEYYLEKFVII